jgi:uncharacterized repeat protein (TIGR03803 family)
MKATYSSLHLFGRHSAEDGRHPEANLIDVKGTLYGTTSAGGTYDAGTVFSITPSGKEIVLHSFGATRDGANPMARLLNVNGTLYGTTAYGGGNLGGTVFRLTLGGEEKVLHSFDSPNSAPQSGGVIPEAGLIDAQGTLYGTTSQGGATACGGYGYHCGTVFSIATSGKFKVLYTFGKQSGDGGFPQAPLLDVDGTLYGTAMSAGIHNHGTVFSITTAGEEHTVYSFGTNERDGSNPMSGLINVQGGLYGTTIKGGSGDAGTVFAVTTDGVEAVSFNLSGIGGRAPVADLKNVKGVLYGTMGGGGVHGLGTVFSITKGGTATLLHSFTGGNHLEPLAGLAAIGGTLYGTTFGDFVQDGSVFSITLQSEDIVPKFQQTKKPEVTEP